MHLTQNIELAFSHLRNKFHGTNLTDANVLNEVTDYIEKDATLSKLAITQSFLKDIKSYVDSPCRLGELKNYINNKESNFVFSAFNAPYFKQLSLDCFYYEELPVPKNLHQKFNSPVLPVKVKWATEGFHDRTVVALFPENHIDSVQLKEDKIFYFIDKFIARFYKITKPLLTIINNQQLTSLREADTSDIERASTCWVYLHETFHRFGAMPIPKYLDVKSIKPLAGLEELRVDILSILYCLDCSEIALKEKQFIAEFILAERLLRYSIEGIPYPNYDAIASQVLFNFLIEKQAIKIDDKKIINIQSNIYESLRAFHNAIDLIEQKISYLDKYTVQDELLAFVKTYIKYDETTTKFLHDDYFVWVKSEFRL